MTLYKGSKKIAPIVNKGLTVHNQDKTVTANGVYHCNEEHTGLGEVTVLVPDPIIEEAEPLVIAENGEYSVELKEGIDGYNRFSATVEIPLGTKTYVLTPEDLDSNVITIVPDEGITGLTEIKIDLSIITQLLSEI